MTAVAETNNLIAKWINATGLPTVLIVGLIGNTVCFLVYSRKFFAKTSCGFYLRALSISDIAYNLAHLLTFVSRGMGFNISDYFQISCKLFFFSTYITGPISAWIEALVSFDRAVNIVAPKRFQFLQKRRNMSLIIASIVLIQFGLYAPVLFYFQLDETVTYQNISSISNGTNETSLFNQIGKISQSCQSRNPNFMQVLTWYDLINSTIFPFVAMLISTTAILAKVRATRSTASVKLQTISSNSFPSRTAKPSCRGNRREHRDFQFAVTSISLCLLFFALNIGLTMNFLLSSYGIIPFDMLQILATCFGLICAGDFSLKLFVYLLVNNHFRSEFFSMVIFKRINAFSDLSLLKGSLRLNDVSLNIKAAFKAN